MIAKMIKQTEVYKANTEEDAVTIIDGFKQKQLSGGYELTKYESKLRTKKVKGEIIDTWYTVTIEKTFNTEED